MKQENIRPDPAVVGQDLEIAITLRMQSDVQAAVVIYERIPRQARVRAVLIC